MFVGASKGPSVVRANADVVADCRRFFKLSQLESYIGEELKVKLREPLEGIKNIEGTLVDCNKEYFLIESLNLEYKLNFNDIDFCKLEPNFSMIQSRVMTKKDGSSFQPPRFAYVYNLKTVSEENSKGSWHGWDISLDSQIESANLYNQAKAFAESINKGEVEVKHTREEEASEKDDNVPF